MAETAWRNRLSYGDNLDVMPHDWCHGHEPTAAPRLGCAAWPSPGGQAIIRWDGAIVTLDDEGGYDFAGRT